MNAPEDVMTTTTLSSKFYQVLFLRPFPSNAALIQGSRMWKQWSRASHATLNTSSTQYCPSAPASSLDRFHHLFSAETHLKPQRTPSPQKNAFFLALHNSPGLVVGSVMLSFMMPVTSGQMSEVFRINQFYICVANVENVSQISKWRRLLFSWQVRCRCEVVYDLQLTV